MPFCRSPHERRLVANAIPPIDIRVVRDETLQHVKVSRTRGNHQYRLAALAPIGVGIDTFRQQCSDHVGMTTLCSQPEGGDPVAILCVDLRPSFNQTGHRYRIAPMGRPMQRSRSIWLGGVDVDALRKQLVDRLLVRLLDRLDKADVCSRSRHDSGSPHRHRDEEQHQTEGRTDARHQMATPDRSS